MTNTIQTYKGIQYTIQRNQFGQLRWGVNFPWQGWVWQPWNYNTTEREAEREAKEYIDVHIR
ncbi:MAG: hypothetical protein ACOYYF_08930 [Chloroflexota bacterium]|nr:hypothetical protein [Chloroflexota bacterium]MBI5704199.1 hypothetical protein [Chloroflexota bacterium]